MVFAALIIGWVLVATAVAILCVAAHRGDAGDELRRADAALPHVHTRLSA